MSKNPLTCDSLTMRVSSEKPFDLEPLRKELDSIKSQLTVPKGFPIAFTDSEKFAESLNRLGSQISEAVEHNSRIIAEKFTKSTDKIEVIKEIQQQNDELKGIAEGIGKIITLLDEKTLNPNAELEREVLEKIKAKV